MTTTTAASPIECARGSWQRSVVLQMQTPGGCYNPVLALPGRIRRVSMRYRTSFEALLARLKAAGYLA